MAVQDNIVLTTLESWLRCCTEKQKSCCVKDSDRQGSEVRICNGDCSPYDANEPFVACGTDDPQSATINDETSMVVEVIVNPHTRLKEEELIKVVSSGSSNADNPAPLRKISHVSVQLAQSLTQRLCDDYVLMDILGQGSFGIVFECCDKNDKSRKFAVKLVDKAEAAPEDIEQEINVHRKLEHPNLLKMHRLIDEKCFACILTDLWTGGDLMKALEGHARLKRRIRCSRLVHIAKQMLSGLAYLHEKNVVHRDIKPDNYLLDRPSLTDKECRVILADFGFACECKKGDRLRRQCGTRSYWAPEMWDKNYASKVDVWAVGVSLYVMVEGTVPFGSEHEVRNKDPECHPLVSRRFMDFLLLLMSKREFHRPMASAILGHRWLSPEDIEMDEGVIDGVNWDLADKQWQPDLEGVKGEHNIAALTNRRLELIDRLRNGPEVEASLASLDSAEATPMNILNKNTFSIVDRQAFKSRTFTWWPSSRLKEVLPDPNEKRLVISENQLAPANAHIVAQMLTEHGIDTTNFGLKGAKTLDRFAEEVNTGVCQLMLDAAKHQSLVRVVDIVLLRLSMTIDKAKHYLIVSADVQPDGTMREQLNRLPGVKKEPHENLRNAAERILLMLPNMQDCRVVFDFKHKEVFEVEEESRSYPGVRTVYRKQIVQGRVAQRDQNSRRVWTMNSFKNARSTKFFSWLAEEECTRKGVKLWPTKDTKEISSLVPAPVGLKVEALGNFLKANNIDPSAFGTAHTKTLQELSMELTTGESILMEMENGRVVRLVDVVLLKILKVNANGGDEVLVVTAETDVNNIQNNPEGVLVHRLPGTKRRADENQFLAAKRVLTRQLRVSENAVNLDANSIAILEEEKDSPSYPGLRTVYRKRIISAELSPGVARIPSRLSRDNSGKAPSRGSPPPPTPSIPEERFANPPKPWTPSLWPSRLYSALVERKPLLATS
mmetsp:Transcript_2492/g.5454  ORF Transcript_2492/g.5454 Transcript_2492/m.5454 type:complete len:947 (+) Transcript_2492:91-2931(+)